MRHPEQTAVGLVVAGFVIACLFCIGWAASMMDGRDWLYLTHFSAAMTLVLYGRSWRKGRRRVDSGARTRWDREPGRASCEPKGKRPLILNLHDSGAIRNGRVPFQNKKPL